MKTFTKFQDRKTDFSKMHEDEIENTAIGFLGLCGLPVDEIDNRLNTPTIGNDYLTCSDITPKQSDKGIFRTLQVNYKKVLHPIDTARLTHDYLVARRAVE